MCLMVLLRTYLQSYLSLGKNHSSGVWQDLRGSSLTHLPWAWVAKFLGRVVLLLIWIGANVIVFHWGVYVVTLLY
jgi:hypothetical protein